MFAGGQTAIRLALVLAAVAGCQAALPRPPPAPPGGWQRWPGERQLRLPAAWAEMFVVQLGARDRSSPLLKAAHSNGLALTFSTVLTTADPKTQVDMWLLRLPMSGTASAGRVVALTAKSAEVAWRYLAPRRGRQFFRGFLPSGALLLLVLQDAGSDSDLRKLGGVLLRLRGALHVLVLTPAAVLRMEPFEPWTGGWGTIRQVSGPLPQALDIPAPGVLGQMRGYKLLLVHEPRDDLRVYDRLYQPAWQHSWNGRILSLIQTQLNCSFRLLRVNKDFGTLALYDISYSLRPLTHSAIHQSVTPAISVTRFVITTAPRRVIPLWTQMAVLFRQEIWLCIAAAYITACSVWYATGRAHQWTHGISVSQSLVDTLCMLLSVDWRSIVFGPYRRGLAERFQVGALSLLCLALTTMYQGALTDVVYNPIQTPAIKSFEELYHNDGVRFISQRPMRLAVPDTEKNQRNSRYLVSSADCSFVILKQCENSFCACTETEIEVKQRIYKTGSPLSLQVLSKPYITIYSSFIIPSRSPYSDAFNIAVGRIMQAGIIPDPSLYASIEHGIEPKPFLLNMKEVKKTRMASLSNSDLRTAFLVLAVGLSLGFLIFLLEIFPAKQIYSKFTAIFSTAEAY